ncbi:cell wall protein [Streptomyces sp. VNUA24]|uniref:cell wall protein n=1 Tax=Streptomyces sp. VNUA24 TaxID=3031131 RepID=UPI0023B8611D|nr:cell wall protein [Streptomyces sp. VNUA24]WEH17706.1 cell wall protein [Streptomyces sp. VNUA24]
MFMRPSTCLTLVLAGAATATAAAVTAVVAGGPAVALDRAPAPGGPPRAVSADPRPTCSGTERGTFPLRTRIRGGPATYVAGGGFHTWALELTNTTERTCGNIHPVVVLTDGARTLERTQPQLEYYDATDTTDATDATGDAGDVEGATPLPVTFERTDSDELVGVLGGHGPGFTVPPGRTLTVRVRLSLTSDATVPNDVVANAAVVERRGDDSEWVGESNDYRFRITDGEGDENDEDAGAGKEGNVRDGGGPAKEGGGTVRGEPRSYPPERRAELAASGVREALPYVSGLLLLSAGGLLVAAVRRRTG